MQKSLFSLYWSAYPRIGSDSPRAALLEAAAHAGRAVQRVSDVHEAVTGPDDLGTNLRAIGEGSQAVIAHYLAVSATQRYRKLTGEPGPLPHRRLDEIEVIAKNMRDVVMRWDDKGERDDTTFMLVDRIGIGVGAHEDRDDVELPHAHISWRDLNSACSQIQEWATSLLETEDEEDESSPREPETDTPNLGPGASAPPE
jgi:hypothetical protein